MQHWQLIRSAVAAFVTLTPAIALAQINIGVVSDGPVAEDRRQIPLDIIAEELRDLVGDEIEVAFPESKRIDGGWTQIGVRAAVLQLLADADVDIILTTGLVAGSEASRIDNLPKPVMAVVVADHLLQRMPVAGDDSALISGKSNFVYLTDFGTIDDEITAFHSTVPFVDHLAVLVDELTYAAIPELADQKARQLESQLGIEISIIRATDSAADVLAALPGDTDAVYVTPLLRFDSPEMKLLGAGLIERRLPSFSLVGLSEILQYDLLLATAGRPEDASRLARRVALNLQRILNGENAGQIDILFRESKRLQINMDVADRIGFAPSYSILADAEQYPQAAIESGPPLSLAMAMNEAVAANLTLKVAAFDPLISQEAIASARAVLRPQLGFGMQRVTIDEDRANPLIQSERSTEAEITGSQLIYADDARANLVAAENLASAADLDYATARLDTQQSAAQAYLGVLRARALENIQRRNLEVTRDNLELALIRERVEFSGRADRLRWESQLATDRQNVIAVEAERRAALSSLNRILNRGQNTPFTAPSGDIAASIAVFEDQRFQEYIDNAAVWEVFQEFSVDKAKRSSPELKRLDALIAAQERQLLASERRHWLPEFGLGAAAGSVLGRSGEGSNLTGTGLDDESWNLALTARLPIFTGGALRARTNADRYALQQLEQSREALEEAIELRTRLALHRASGSYPAIETAQAAFAAAAENYQLVNAAYTQGVVSITDLIDAQRAANIAELRAADTEFAALIDVIDVFRATGDFSVFLNAEGSDAWYEEIGAYFAEHGVSIRR